MSPSAHACTRAVVLGLLMLLVAAAIAQPAYAKGKAEQSDDAGTSDAGAPNGKGRPDDAGKPDAASQGQNHEPRSESGMPNASPEPTAASTQSPAEDIPGGAPDEAGNAAHPPARGNPETSGFNGFPPQASPDDLPTTAAPAAANLDLKIARLAAGNLLEWHAPGPAEGAEGGAVLVAVLRQVGDDWVTVASLPADAGLFVDADAPADAVYRLAWTSQVAVPLGPDPLEGPLATLAPGLVQDGSMGAWMAGLLWGAIAVIAAVRSPAQPSVQDTRVTKDQLLLSALGGLPGIDAALVQRVQAMGLRTVGQLRAIDPEALAFWTNLPASLFRRWQEAVDMLQWPLLPTGAAQRLALAGASSLAEVAAADPKTLYAELHAAPGIATVGPGLPDHPDQVEVWVTEAQKVVRGAGRLAAGASSLRGRAPS